MSIKYVYGCHQGGSDVELELFDILENESGLIKNGKMIINLSNDSFYNYLCPNCNENIEICQLKRGGVGFGELFHGNPNYGKVREVIKNNDILITGLKVEMRAKWHELFPDGIISVLGQSLDGIDGKYYSKDTPLSVKDIIHRNNTNGWSRKVGSYILIDLKIYE